MHDWLWSVVGILARETERQLRAGNLPVPSDSPAFLAILGLHVPTGLVCVLAGAAAMLSPKRPGRHPRFGTVYFWSLGALFATTCALSSIRWHPSLFTLGSLSMAAAVLGFEARRRRWADWLRLHVVGMGLSYVLLLTAFYVDNGPSLPFWRHLPAVAYWVVPSAIGVPLIIRSLRSWQTKLLAELHNPSGIR
jgi:hypothetical protein